MIDNRTRPGIHGPGELHPLDCMLARGPRLKIRNAKKALTEAYRAIDPNAQVTFLECEKDLLHYEVVSDMWFGVRLFRRIELGVEIAMRSVPGILDHYTLIVAPITIREKEQFRCRSKTRRSRKRSR